MKKILVIGDYESAAWHPLKGVDERLSRLLTGYDINFTEDYSGLTWAELKQYDLLICYADAWKTKGTKQTAGAILSYVADGGSILTLHSGIIMHSTPEMELMHGGRFTGHPEACGLTYSPTASSSPGRDVHPIMDGIESFTIFEEPYRLTMAEFAEHEALMTYSHEGRDWCAAWALSYGMGKVVYLSVGHQAASFDNEMFGKLIVNSVIWCTSEGEGNNNV